jgi:hypothetical protein
MALASTTMLIAIVTAIAPSSSSVVAALRPLRLRNAGTPLEIASTPVSAAQPDANARRSRNANAKLVSPLVNSSWTTSSYCALSAAASRPSRAEEAPRRHAEDRRDEHVGRDREHRPRLLEPAQVHGREEQHCQHGNQHLLTPGALDRGGRVLGRRRDGHRDGEDVVDEQRAAHDEARCRPRLVVVTS